LRARSSVQHDDSASRRADHAVGARHAVEHGQEARGEAAAAGGAVADARHARAHLGVRGERRQAQLAARLAEPLEHDGAQQRHGLGRRRREAGRREGEGRERRGVGRREGHGRGRRHCFILLIEVFSGLKTSYKIVSRYR